VGAVLAALTLGLAGCSAAEAETSPSAAPEHAADAVTIEDAWVKAADSGMTAGFGVLVNDGAADATLVSATTDAAMMTELHETVTDDAGAMVMREVEEGLTIPADGELTLEPGGNHLMMMQLTGPLQAGAEVTFTLEFADGSTLDVTAPVKDFTGAEENYDGGDDHEDMGH
jgi:copper(I)-binding protein